MTLLNAPPWRVRAIHDDPPRADGAYVLYWMIAARRPAWNFALDRAIDWADELGKPLLVLEALRSDYAWASDRIHQFVIDGMRANARALEKVRVSYYPYLEDAPRAGRGLLQALAADAAMVVTDRSPVFDLASLVSAASRRISTRFEEVDGYGVVPIDAPSIVFPTAFAFRRYLQRGLREFLAVRPRPEVQNSRDRRLKAPLSESITGRWPSAAIQIEGNADLSRFPIDHRVSPAGEGGPDAARKTLDRFIEHALARYDRRAHPDEGVSSGLSPYLHFGHVSPHEVLFRVVGTGDWSLDTLSRSTAGKKEGWWGASPQVEAFLDQLITWRELGGNATRRGDYMTYESLPAWAKATLEKHASDARKHLYSLDEFAVASTHDPVWNAAQRELVTEGRLQNYMRMLWGKKILEWTRSPNEALDVMIELNNRYALDGRDPNWYSGIFWVLGRYDRPWGPERPIFGSIRYMTSESATRKLRMTEYLRRYGTSRLF